MSYSVSVEQGPAETFLERFDAAVEKADLGSDEQQAEAAREALAAARVALEALLDADSVVKPGQECTATVSGYANPGHEPRDGFTLDSQSISISQSVPA